MLKISDSEERQVPVALNEDWVEIPQASSLISNPGEKATFGAPGSASTPEGTGSLERSTEMGIDIILPGGFGLSVLDGSPVELAYLSSRGIKFTYTVGALTTSLDAVFQHLQVCLSYPLLSYDVTDASLMTSLMPLL